MVRRSIHRYFSRVGDLLGTSRRLEATTRQERKRETPGSRGRSSDKILEAGLGRGGLGTLVVRRPNSFIRVQLFLLPQRGGGGLAAQASPVCRAAWWYGDSRYDSQALDAFVGKKICNIELIVLYLCGFFVAFCSPSRSNCNQLEFYDTEESGTKIQDSGVKIQGSGVNI